MENISLLQILMYQACNWIHVFHTMKRLNPYVNTPCIKLQEHSNREIEASCHLNS
jgi:hypothetical protein